MRETALTLIWICKSSRTNQVSDILSEGFSIKQRKYHLKPVYLKCCWQKVTQHHHTRTHARTQKYILPGTLRLVVSVCLAESVGAAAPGVVVSLGKLLEAGRTTN